jgi:aspartyl-tRNA(Asn)/glutamyl-tRNA(Gln) amidotransferase subunit A
MELHKHSIKDLLSGLARKSFSATEVVKSFLARMENQRDLNSFVLETPEQALEAAKQADSRLAKGEALLLDGVPIAVKDLFCTKDIRTTACSKILSSFVPTYESTVTANLFANGGIMLGKTNMDEFAMGSANANSFFGPVKNPWKRRNDNRDLVPGGSSGGSAAAVAAGLGAGALGSDTGGSIRQPASFCGIVGIKPTYGRCSRYGMIAFASSLDQAGVFARNVHDAAILLEAISGFDAKDSTSVNRSVPEFSKLLSTDLKGKKIGIPKEYRIEGMIPEVEKLWDEGANWLRAQGAEIIDISLPHTHYALPAYYILAPAEASSNLARYDGVRYGERISPEGGNLNDLYEHTRADGFGREVRRRILIGTYVLSAGYYEAYYAKAQRVRTLIANDFKNAFTQVDAILTPTAPSDAFAMGEVVDPVTMYLNDVFTIPASLAGLPGASIPAGLSANGLPLGLQIIAKPWDEVNLLQISSALEHAANFDTSTKL